MEDVDIKVEWRDDIERGIFSSRGLSSFSSFWNMEESGANIEYKDIRIHKGNAPSGRERQIACIKFEQNIKYFLKRGEGKGFTAIKSEFEAFPKAEKFGFKTAKIVAYAFDEENKRAFLIMKNLAGCLCLHDVVSGKLHPEMIARYQVNEKQIISNIARCIVSYQKGNYFYPDLKAKHIFFNRHNADICLIDLERFAHADDLPFYYRIKFFAKFLHNCEIKTLLHSVSASVQSQKALKKAIDLEMAPDDKRSPKDCDVSAE
ncbi:MAG TPA: lipopolysaccharide kinase InaA family protein [Victivallales bacterium]|mgnify:CR=1 FL=1|nr:lipopolysaccharide kinase InaA family protein [Victivallales bacterium]